jgi:MFS family permease
VYSATHSAAWVGAATICRGLVKVLLGPFGGTIADRYRRRTVLLAGDALRMLLMVAIAAAVASAGPVALVIAFTALTSAAGCAESPASMALLPRLVGEIRLGPANALLYTVQDLGVVMGPAIGAMLLAVAPAWVAFVANGATFAISALLISTIRPDRARGGGRRSGVAELADGLRTVRTTAFALSLIVVVAMVELTYGAQTVQLVLYARRVSLLVLGAVALAITLLCSPGLRGLDALNAHRAGALASRVRVLQGLPVTVGVPQIVLEQLAVAAQFYPLPPGIDVVVLGAPAHAFYAVVDGRVVVHRDGKAVVHLGPGDSFGERGLLDHAPRNATVTTEMDTTLLRVEGDALLDALEAAPSLRPALDLSSAAPGVQVPPGETKVVDDPRWVET